MKKTKIGFMRDNSWWEEEEIYDKIWHMFMFQCSKRMGKREFVVYEYKDSGKIEFNGNVYSTLQEAKEKALNIAKTIFFGRVKLYNDYFNLD